jgi:hypothetical protein
LIAALVAACAHDDVRAIPLVSPANRVVLQTNKKTQPLFAGSYRVSWLDCEGNAIAAREIRIDISK